MITIFTIIITFLLKARGRNYLLVIPLSLCIGLYTIYLAIYYSSLLCESDEKHRM